MCKETSEEVFALATAEQAKHLRLLSDKGTKEFDKWWRGKIWGWYDATEGDLAGTRKILGLPPCECPKSATNQMFLRSKDCGPDKVSGHYCGDL